MIVNCPQSIWCCGNRQEEGETEDVNLSVSINTNVLTQKQDWRAWNELKTAMMDQNEWKSASNWVKLGIDISELRVKMLHEPFYHIYKKELKIVFLSDDVSSLTAHFLWSFQYYSPIFWGKCDHMS